jgi:hypothetical protein
MQLGFYLGKAFFDPIAYITDGIYVRGPGKDRKSPGSSYAVHPQHLRLSVSVLEAVPEHHVRKVEDCDRCLVWSADDVGRPDIDQGERRCFAGFL